MPDGVAASGAQASGVLPDWVDALAGVRHDEPLAGHLQYGVGGRAERWLRLADAATLPELVRRCGSDAVPITVLGAGSNTLVLDGGIPGLVIQFARSRMRVIDATTVELDAGAMMPRAAFDLASRGLAGLEFGVGIPGTLGASVRGNAGAYGQDMAAVIVDCDVLLPDGRKRVVGPRELEMSYRRTAISDGALAGAIVLAARLRVRADEPVSVRARTDEITEKRRVSQPWGRRSLGSTFKNPDGDHAGRLLEMCGMKGLRVGGAMVAHEHANFILNVDRATSQDVLALVAAGHDVVRERTGVDLEREIVLVGRA